MTDRLWDSKNPDLVYQYLLTHGTRRFSGVNIPAPPLLKSRLAFRWLFGPYFDSKFYQRQQNKQASTHRSNQNISAMSTARYKSWYSQHISDDLRLKALAPLSCEQLEHITSPLDDLLNHPELQKLEAPETIFNPLLESLQNSALQVASKAIVCEKDLQTAVFPIFHSIVNIVSTAFTRSRIQPPPGDELDICYTFDANYNDSNNQDAIDNIYLLRTSTKPQTSITADYFVHLHHDRTTGGVLNPERITHVLRDSLLQPGNIVLVAAEFKPGINFEWPSSRVAYPNVMCRDSHVSSAHHDANFHIFDFKVFPEGSPEKADFQPARLQVLDAILGTDQQQDEKEEELPFAKMDGAIEQLWAQMVSQGTYIGLLMDWHNRNHICVREPRTGTLYISPSLNNPLVGTAVGQRSYALQDFFSAMERKSFPWVDEYDRHSVMYVIGGAVLTGFNLLHPNPPPNLFVPDSEANGDLWEAARLELEERRQRRREEAKAMSVAELSIYHEHNNNGQGQGPAGASGGPGSSQGDVSSSRYDNSTNPSGASTGSGAAETSHGLGDGRTSQFTRKQGMAIGRTPEKIYVGIFDGDLYHSQKLEIFDNWGSRIPRSNSPVSIRNRTSSLTSHPDERYQSSSDTTSRTPSPIFDRSLTPSSSKSDPTTLSHSPPSLHMVSKDLLMGHDFSLELGKQYPSFNLSNTNHSESKVPIVFLNRFVVEGAVGDVWQGYASLPDQAGPIPIAAKIAFTRQAMDSLEHEHNIYRWLGGGPDLPIPTMYGYYKNISNTGQQVGLLLLSWIDGIAPQCRQEVQKNEVLIKGALTKLHAKGVVHGDLAPRNMLINEGKVTLIDFDRAGVYDKSSDVDLKQLHDMCLYGWSL